MFNFIDKKLEKVFRNILHKRKEHYIKKAIETFIQSHPNSDIETTNILKKRLEIEANRVYLMIDESILKASIRRAKYTFWITLLLSLVLIGTLSVVTYGAGLPLLIPLITAFIGWLAILTTIPVAYNERVKGGLDTILLTFENDLSEGNHEINHLIQPTKEMQRLFDNRCKGNVEDGIMIKDFDSLFPKKQLLFSQPSLENKSHCAFQKKKKNKPKHFFSHFFSKQSCHQHSHEDKERLLQHKFDL